MSDIAKEKYVRLTTFTKDGRRKESPVWIADLGNGTMGFTTEPDSWKVKRINNTPTVELTPSTMRGKVADDAVSVAGTATIALEGDTTATQTAIRAKYGLEYRMIDLWSRISAKFGKKDGTPCAVIITLDD